MSSIAQRVITRLVDLTDVDGRSFQEGSVPRWSVPLGKFEGAYYPTDGILGQVITMVIIGGHQVPAYAAPVPAYEQQPYRSAASGTDTMPEDAGGVMCRDLTGDLHLRLRDAYNLNISLMIFVKAGLLNGHTLTLVGQDGNLIEGAGTYVMTADKEGLLLVGSANNGTWTIVGSYRAT